MDLGSSKQHYRDVYGRVRQHHAHQYARGGVNDKHAGRAMVERKICNSIVCTETVATALGGGSAPCTYTTSKHALVGLVRSAYSKLGAHGIRVNCISPFGVATPLACNAYNLDPDSMEAGVPRSASLNTSNY
uniref:Uncharacterized protein n=1 Tax=Nelumbo nucifera TaxID=4432 RepID=A0A822ZMK5_NELNU|nr:TPA_asm: hypothetical protein HUJ06_002935 [Nelumbo nucifera]